MTRITPCERSVILITWPPSRRQRLCNGSGSGRLGHFFLFTIIPRYIFSSSIFFSNFSVPPSLFLVWPLRWPPLAPWCYFFSLRDCLAARGSDCWPWGRWFWIIILFGRAESACSDHFFFFWCY